MNIIIALQFANIALALFGIFLSDSKTKRMIWFFGLMGWVVAALNETLLLRK